MNLTLTTFDEELNITRLYNFDSIASAVDTAEAMNPKGYFVTCTYYDKDVNDDVTRIVWDNNVEDVYLSDMNVLPFTPRYR